MYRDARTAPKAAPTSSGTTVILVNEDAICEEF
jgi:hypothetical protein